MNRSKNLDLLLYVWYILFFISMVGSFRAISSISIGLLCLTGVIKNKRDTGSWLNRQLKSRLPAACCLFYLIQITALLHTTAFHESIKDLQTKSGMFFVPLAVYCCNYLNTGVRRQLMKYYIWILAAALLYCLLLASYRYYLLNAQNTVFYYHELVSPFRQHAVFVSIYLFTGLLYLLENAKNGFTFCNTYIHFLLIFYFTCCILLLSSKLVITFSAGCLVYYGCLVVKERSRFVIITSLFAGLAMIILALSTQNRISQRFNEIMSGNLSLVQQQHFTPAVYFNGLQFRLLQWRFVKEILTENHAWFTGVSGNAQALLNKKYFSTHMYTGGANSITRGYLGYNTHNQFLQSLLQSGMLGLLAFILLCCAMVGLVTRRQSSELAIIVLLLMVYCFNEAVLETQYGIILFTFLPLFIYYGTEEKYLDLSI